MKIMAFGVLVLLLLAPVIQWQRRRDARYFFERLCEQAPLRVLSVEERAALTPLQACLDLTVAAEVRALSGPHTREVLRNRGTSFVRERVGGVDVLLPFDAADHLAEQNTAEVVLGPGYAIVVRLNGFDITTAGSRALRTPAQHLGERMEHPEERRLRRRPGTPWAAAGLALLANACGVALRWDNGPWAWGVLGAGLALMLLSAGFYLRRQVGPAALQPIDRVRGRLNRLQLLRPGDPAGTGCHLLIGNDQRIRPCHDWNESKGLQAGRRIEAEIYRHSRRVLSLGPGWSMLDEHRRCPPVPLARHALMLAVALVSLCLALGASDGPTYEVQRAMRLFSAHQLRTDADPGSLLQRPPAIGDGVHLRVRATCELVPQQRHGHTVATADCDRVRWGVPQVPMAELEIAEPILRLGSYDTQLRTQYTGATDLLAPFRQVTGLGDLLERVDAACVQGLYACGDLQSTLLRLLSWQSDHTAHGDHDWASLMRAARLASDEAGREGLTFPSHVIRKINTAVKAAVDAHVLSRWAAQTPALLAQQQGGVVLVTASPGEVHSVGNAWLGTAHDQWKRMRAAATIARPVTVSGTVTARIHDGRTQWLEIDPTEPSHAAIAGLGRCAWLLAALLLMLFHGVQCARYVPRAIARRSALDEDILQRPAPMQRWSP